MNRKNILIALLSVLAACSTARVAPGEPADWEPGEYFLDATVSAPGGAVGATTSYQAQLSISLTGAISMTSSTGFCQDPAVPASDQPRQERIFECGETTYRLKPASKTVIGEITAPVVVERTVTECVRYATDPKTGERICAETRERVERTTRPARSALRVRREPPK